MTIEEALAAVLEAKLAPVRADVGRLVAEVEAMRRSIPPVLVSMTEAAKRLGVSVSTIRRRVRDGSLPTRRIGFAVRVDLTALHPPSEAEVVRLVDATRRG